MNTIISTLPNSGSHFYATNIKNVEFELKFWRSLSNLQEQGRWLLVISPLKTPNKNLLKEAGINVSRMLIVHNQDKKESFNITKRAIEMGKCCAVVSWLDNIDNQTHNILAQAAINANTGCVIVKPTHIKASQKPKLKLVS